MKDWSQDSQHSIVCVHTTDTTQKPGPGAHSPEKVKITKRSPPAYSLGVRHSEYLCPLIIEVADWYLRDITWDTTLTLSSNKHNWTNVNTSRYVCVVLFILFTNTTPILYKFRPFCAAFEAKNKESVVVIILVCICTAELDVSVFIG